MLFRHFTPSAGLSLNLLLRVLYLHLSIQFGSEFLTIKPLL